MGRGSGLTNKALIWTASSINRNEDRFGTSACRADDFIAIPGPMSRRRHGIFALLD